MTNPALDKVLIDLKLKQGAEMRIRDEVWTRYFAEQELQTIVEPNNPLWTGIGGMLTGTVSLAGTGGLTNKVRLPWVPRVEEVIKLLERTMNLKAGSAMVPGIRKAISDLRILLD